ncbi:UNVERIFIED_CONTAM: glycosylphosphatidylinositol anchor biosynthesis [Siphonaria sp. JEL0065]|nr:glycosylphosphatidylinositol anchor biosynthesis [Siphonaria sp. JEL0065]
MQLLQLLGLLVCTAASVLATTAIPNSNIVVQELKTMDSASALAGSFFGKSSNTNSKHTNNWAVLVCTSRFWFNYRHIANTLSMYRTVKRLGIPDSNIILMLADDVACNSRNHFPATVFNNAGRLLDLYGSNIEVDYRGYEVTVENFIRVLTGRHESHVPRSKRLLTDDRSNVLIFMTGHGGKEFLKFQDAEEIGSHDVGDAIAQMHEKKRYNEIFFMIDTCQAASMYNHIYSPNVVAAASSLTGQSSYSHHHDSEIGTAVIDRWTYSNLETLEKLDRQDKATLGQLFATYNPEVILSTPGIRTDLFPRGVDNTLVTDFFGAVQSIELTPSGYKRDKRQKSLKPDARIDLNSDGVVRNTDEKERKVKGNLRTVTPQPYLINAPFCLALIVFVGGVLALGAF